MRRHRNRLARIVLPALVAASLVAACSRGADGTNTAGDDASTTSQDPAPPEATAPGDSRDYYASLVARHGEDLAECGPAETATAGACAQGDTAGAETAPRRVLLMLDSSGSMAARQSGRSKLTVAQDALLDYVRKSGGDAQFALRVYGHTGSNREADKAASCRGTELVQPFAPRDMAAFERAVRSFQPRGFTPIAGSLQAAAQDFARGNANASGNVVYLVSDGIETCGGDPAAAARALNASEIKVVVNVIGFDVDAQAERQLRGVAQAGGGAYVAARDANDLQQVFARQLDAATKQFGCAVGEEVRAFGTTVNTHTARWTCLVGKAVDEYSAVIGAATQDFSAGRITAAQRDDAMAQAKAKRDGIMRPATEVRDRAVDAVTTQRDRGVDAARRERDEALDAAEAARGD